MCLEGATQKEMLLLIQPHLPQSLFPEGAKLRLMHEGHAARS